jgi:copper chaperone
MESRIKVENIRCGGCANSIRKKLSEDTRIDSIEVDIEQQTVIIRTENDDLSAVKADAVQKLLHLGYPEKGSVEGLQALKGKAKSVISCAIGKVS